MLSRWFIPTELEKFNRFGLLRNKMSHLKRYAPPSTMASCFDSLTERKTIYSLWLFNLAANVFLHRETIFRGNKREPEIKYDGAGKEVGGTFTDVNDLNQRTLVAFESWKGLKDLNKVICI